MTIWNELFRLFYPALCVSCGRPLVRGEDQICIRCLSDLPVYHPSAEKHFEQIAAICPFVGSIEIFLRYDKGGKVQHLIHKLKYYGQKQVGFRLGVLAALHLQRAESPICKADVLIPVPLHPRKQRKRGYNQAEWICKGMSSVLQIPVDTRFLHRVSYTETQTKKSVAERWDNLHSRFRVDGTCDWQGKRLVLVDDVLTTGATLVDCASAINAKSVTSDVTLFALSAV